MTSPLLTLRDFQAFVRVTPSLRTRLESTERVAMSTSTTIHALVLAVSGGVLLACAIQYARGRDRTVISILVPIQLAVVIQSVGVLFLSERGSIAASIVSMVLVIPAIVQSSRLIRRSRSGRFAGPP